MDLSLHGKVALVTGGGRGLGRSIVRGLTQSGAHVVVTAEGGRSPADHPQACPVCPR